MKNHLLRHVKYRDSSQTSRTVRSSYGRKCSSSSLLSDSYKGCMGAIRRTRFKWAPAVLQCSEYAASVQFHSTVHAGLHRERIAPVIAMHRDMWYRLQVFPVHVIKIHRHPTVKKLERLTASNRSLTADRRCVSFVVIDARFDLRLHDV